MGASIIQINDKTYEVSGNNISINGNAVFVDGKQVVTGLEGIVEIKFEGDLASLKCHNANIKGDIIGPVHAHNITCENVKGNIQSHNIKCGGVVGDIKGKNITKTEIL